MRATIFWAFAASIAASAAPALAADVPATSKIEAVTVFPSGAEVMRTVKVKLDAGDHTVLLNDLTGQTVASSVRVEGQATGKLEIGSVDMRRMELPSTDPAVVQSARKKIEDQIGALRDQYGELTDVIKTAEEQRNYLQSLERLPQTPIATGATAPAQDWAALYTLIGTRMTELAKTIREAKLKQRDLDRQIKELKKELAAAGGKSQDRTELRIYVTAGAPLEATLTVRYQVTSASWTAFYDARLATGDKDKGAARKLSIARYASISQTTGEDWEDVALSLSTTRPGTSTAAPELGMLSVDFSGSAASGTARSMKGESNAPAQAPMIGGLMGEQDAQAPLEKSEFKQEQKFKKVLQVGKRDTMVVASTFQAVYGLPGKATIKTTGEAKRLQIMTEEMEPSLLVRTVPRLDHNAYLYAKFALPKTSSPVLAGQVSLLRDGVMVGIGQLPQLAPGEDMELGFGADERVKVKRAISEDTTGETGTFTTSHMEQRSYAITVKNLHAHQVELQVIDRMPVPLQQDIKVDFFITKGSQPTAKDVNDKRGTMLWQMTTAPDEEKQLAFGYRITAPRDKPIHYREISDADLQVMQGARIKF